MMAHKKAATAGTGAASNTAENRPHLNASDRLRECFDGEKPSRQNRRQKRGWKRKPKNALDLLPMQRHYGCTVLNTPSNSGNRSRQTSGIFTSIGFLWSGSAQLYNSLRAKTASGLLAVLKYPTAPQQGGFSTNPIGTIMHTLTSGATASIRLSVYRFIRHFSGPATAIRLARFVGRASA